MTVEEPLTDDARRWLDGLREHGVEPAGLYEGDSLTAVINRALLNRLVAAERAEIERVLTELDGPFTGLTG